VAQGLLKMSIIVESKFCFSFGSCLHYSVIVGPTDDTCTMTIAILISGIRSRDRKSAVALTKNLTSKMGGCCGNFVSRCRGSQELPGDIFDPQMALCVRRSVSLAKLPN
jgi:hypothetical protein